jgi:hypothetical protein
VRRFSDEMAFPVYGWQMLEAVAAMIVGFLMLVILFGFIEELLHVPWSICPDGGTVGDNHL